MAQLLVSVRSVTEANLAIEGGAAVIDVKEPARGPLGRGDDATIAAVVRAVGGRRSVSAALGELHALDRGLPLAGCSFCKCGLAGLLDKPWRRQLDAFIQTVSQRFPSCTVVAVAYADWHLAGAPSPDEVLAFACSRPDGVLLIDTFTKAPFAPAASPPTLLDFMSIKEVELVLKAARPAGVRVALAGSLGHAEIDRLRPLGPDWLAVRGAACRGGKRGEPIERDRVRALADRLTGSVMAKPQGG